MGTQRSQADFGVVVVSDFAFVNGGAPKVAIETALALAGSGRPVVFFGASGDPDPRLAAAGVRVVVLKIEPHNRRPPSLHNLRSGIWDHHTAASFASLLESLPSDRPWVVHIHAFMDALTSSVPAVARRSGRPTLFTLHDYGMGCPYGTFYDVRRRRQCPLAGLSAACWMTNCTSSAYPRKLFRNLRLAVQRRRGIPWPTATYAAVSSYAAERIRPYLPQDARLLVLHNPIPIEKRELVEVGQNQSFVFLGAITEVKGVRLLAQAATQTHTPVRFVGDGPLRPKLSARYPGFEWLGWQEPPVVERVLRQSRALVFPSVLHETAGMVVQEAVARGLPAVVPDRCAAREFVVDGETGLIFQSGDADSLAETLERLKSDSLVSQMGRNAFERYWSAPFTPERYRTELESIFLSILEAS